MQKILLFFFGLSLFLLTGCDSRKINPAELIGKTKGEILEIVFAQCPQSSCDGINIGVENGNGSYENFYCKSMDAALNDPHFMQSDIWEIGKREKFTVSIYKRVEGIKLFFKDGKVIKFEMTKWDMT